jgi:hypothetical protein
MTDAVGADQAPSSPCAPPDDAEPVETPAEAEPPADAASTEADAASPESPQFDPRLEIRRR